MKVISHLDFFHTAYKALPNSFPNLLCLAIQVFSLPSLHHLAGFRPTCTVILIQCRYNFTHKWYHWSCCLMLSNHLISSLIPWFPIPFLYLPAFLPLLLASLAISKYCASSPIWKSLPHCYLKSHLKTFLLFLLFNAASSDLMSPFSSSCNTINLFSCRTTSCWSVWVGYS